MSNLLKKHQKQKIRKTYGDFIVYNIITKEQRDKLTEFLSKNARIQSENGKDFIKENLGADLTKELLREFTNIGEEVDKYTNEEINKLIDNGDSDLQDVVREVGKLLNEFTKEYYYNIDMTLDGSINSLDLMETVNKLEGIQNRFGLTEQEFSTLIKGQFNIAEFEKELERLKEESKKSTIKKPQDHKRKRRTKAQIEADKKKEAELNG